MDRNYSQKQLIIDFNNSYLLSLPAAKNGEEEIPAASHDSDLCEL